MRKLPGRLRSGEAATHDVHGLYFIRCHSMIIRPGGSALQR
jgi:hypothetical protein